jgi:hypothetical protein
MEAQGCLSGRRTGGSARSTWTSRGAMDGARGDGGSPAFEPWVFEGSGVATPTYDEYASTMRRLALSVKPLLDMAPPDPASRDPRDLAVMARIAEWLRALPRADFDLPAVTVTVTVAPLRRPAPPSSPRKAAPIRAATLGTVLAVRTSRSRLVTLAQAKRTGARCGGPARVHP